MALIAALAVVGSLMLFIGARASVRQAAFNRRAIATTGRAIAWQATQTEISSGSYRTVYFPTVEYHTQAGHICRQQGLGAPQPGPEGTPIPLLYDPRDPNNVSFTGKRGQLGLAKMLVVLGAITLAAAAGLGVRLLLQLTRH